MSKIDQVAEVREHPSSSQFIFAEDLESLCLHRQNVIICIRGGLILKAEKGFLLDGPVNRNGTGDLVELDWPICA